MSQATTTTAMTTTPTVTVVHSDTSPLLSMVTMAPSLMGLQATSGQHDVVLPPLLTPRHPGGVIGPATVPQQQPPSQMPLQTFTNYAMGPPQVGFSFRVEPPSILYFYMFHVFWCMLSAFRCHAGCFIHQWGLNHLGFALLLPFVTYPWQTYVQPDDGHLPTPGMHRVSAPSMALSRGEPPATQSAVPKLFQLYGGAYSFGGLAESFNPSTFPAWWGGIFFSRFGSIQ